MKHINKKEINKNTQQYKDKLYHSQDISKVIYMEQHYNTQPIIRRPTYPSKHARSHASVDLNILLRAPALIHKH